jgi:uncharacterized protein YbaP (TraB family)
VHLLPPEMNWKRDEIERARAASGVFVFEDPLKDAEAAMKLFVEAHGHLPHGRTLKDKLTTKQYEALEKAAWTVQYPPMMLAPLRPWLAAVYLELYSYLKVGYSPFYGVDHVIEQEASLKGAKFAYLESVQEQLSYFVHLGGRAEIDYLNSTVDGVLNEPEMPEQLVNAWASGDVGALSRLIDKGFEDSPKLREQLLVARNRKWTPQLISMLKSGETHFVTVGAGHLIGRDGIVATLRARGYKVTGP